MRQKNEHIVILVSCASFLLLSYVYELSCRNEEAVHYESLVQWLRGNSLGACKELLDSQGVWSLKQVADMTQAEVNAMSTSCLPEETFDAADLFESIRQLRRQLALCQWLENEVVEVACQKLMEMGISSLHSLLKPEGSDLLIRLSRKDGISHLLAEESLERLRLLASSMDLDEYPMDIEKPIFLRLFRLIGSITALCAKLVVALSIAAAAILIYIFLLFGRALYALVTRPVNYRIPRSSPLEQLVQKLGSFFKKKIQWNRIVVECLWEEPSQVGEERTFRIKIYRSKFLICEINNVDKITVDVSVGDEALNCSLRPNKEYVDVVFIPKLAGAYKIVVHCSGCISDGPLYKTFLPGPVDADHTTINNKTSYAVMKTDQDEMLQFQLRDKFENPCVPSKDILKNFHVTVERVGSSKADVSPEMKYFVLEQEEGILMVRLKKEGCYQAKVYYLDKLIKGGEMVFIVLAGEWWSEFTEVSRTPSFSRWFECYLIPQNGTGYEVDAVKAQKKRKVFVYLTSKFLVIKEYILKIFPRTLLKVKVNPSTKLMALPSADPLSQQPTFMLKSGGDCFVLACEKRTLILAIFGYWLRSSVGGSENFESKKRLFYCTIRESVRKSSQSETTIKVRRSHLLLDSIKQTKHYSTSDWGKVFTVTFIGELGLDYGGPRREWFHLVGEALFDPKNKLFRTFSTREMDGLIHPNPFRPDYLKKLKYYEFAGRIVGKCQLECAQGKERQQYIQARFSRSFLAQVIGLKVHWKHFETDDKELYVGKIKYILEHDPEDLGLTFTEEVFDDQQHLVKVVDLKPMGSSINVTEQNKLEYLQLLAEYKLCLSVKDEVAAFVKGLYDVITEDVVAMFDEYELELLICGLTKISVSDLKLHHTKDGSSLWFHKVINWFWTILSGFSQEELARLVQFTTGCGRLPPGGFKDLRPTFHIVESPRYNSLPTAHTCFNRLYLPNYPSMDEFRRKLVITINEGAEGFGLM